MNGATTMNADALWTEDVRAQAHAGLARASLCSCDYPYHPLWGILRAAGVTGSLRFEETLLAPMLAARIGAHTRVLIAGSADTGTLCAVGRAAGTHRPEITVLDRCAAPLDLIATFAAERRIACHTLGADLRALEAREAWDLVLVNYTLAYIAPDDRADVFARLARALVPGGALVVAAKTGTRPAGESGTWIAKARARIAEAWLDLPLSAEELDTLLRQGAAGRVRRQAGAVTFDDLKALIAAAGLTLTDAAASARERALRASGETGPVEASVVLSAVKP